MLASTLASTLVDGDGPWSGAVDVLALVVIFVCGYRIGRHNGERNAWEEIEEKCFDGEEEG